jgi:hypothetical protein
VPEYHMIVYDFGAGVGKHLLLGDAIHHPGNEGEVMKFDVDTAPGGVPPVECCCLGDTCICIPQLAAAEYPDLLICISRNSGTTCDGDDCFDPEVCCTLAWNGTEYAVDGCTFDCAAQEFLAIRLACNSVTDVKATCEAAPCGPTEWQIQFVCGTDCFEGCFTPSACSPFAMSGTVCKSTECCLDGFGSPVTDACLDFEITLAP